jgi:hypothetical protein
MQSLQLDLGDDGRGSRGLWFCVRPSPPLIRFQRASAHQGEATLLKQQRGVRLHTWVDCILQYCNEDCSVTSNRLQLEVRGLRFTGTD